MPYKPLSKSYRYTELLKSTAFKRLRQRVLQEEDFCALCGEEVDKSLSGLNPEGPHVDHIISFSQNQDLTLFFSRENVQLTHRKCNIKKGT